VRSDHINQRKEKERVNKIKKLSTQLK